MTVEIVRQVLAWCSLINIVLLMAWFLGLVVARDWVHGLHGRWFRLTDEQFDAVHYAGMAFFKLTVLVFNIVPYLVLRMLF
jgi:hypothetical protein